MRKGVFAIKIVKHCFTSEGTRLACCLILALQFSPEHDPPRELFLVSQ